MTSPADNTFLYTNEEIFIAAAVEFIENRIMVAVKERGAAVVGLSGGSTPLKIYQALGVSTRIEDWSKVWFFLVDDRYVASDHKDSNQTLLRNSLLAGNVPRAQLTLPDTTLPLLDCLAAYEHAVITLLAKSGGVADLVTLGMGPDGHIASLFPNPSVPDKGFQESPAVIHMTTEKFAVFDRISVTMPVITKSRASIFFMKGADKKQAWDEMLADSEQERRWPAKAVLATDKCVVYALV